jgi:hypothetical protein
MTDTTHKPSEHTPGPWRRVCHRDGSESIEGSGNIAIVWLHPTRKHNSANAALIARAPELLAENERLKEALEVAKCDLFNAGYDPTGEAVCRIESALSRTEPEQGKDGGE